MINVTFLITHQNGQVEKLTLPVMSDTGEMDMAFCHRAWVAAAMIVGGYAERIEITYD